MADTIEEPDSPFPKRIPKYKAPDFMQKEMELFLRARNGTALVRRNGDDDAPIARISPLTGIRRIGRVSEINHTIR
jgi:hypothetical protein